MTGLKEQLRVDLTAAIKSQDKLTTGTLRMALAAVSTEEVSGDKARTLSDDEVRRVLTREVKKRKEAAEAFASAGRVDQAEVERQEGTVLAAYLPAQLSDAELAVLVGQAVTEIGGRLGTAPGPKQMGQVMKVVNTAVAGRAEGGRVAGAVKARLSG
jgi:uncharacterized protein YqeY